MRILSLDLGASVGFAHALQEPDLSFRFLQSGVYWPAARAASHPGARYRLFTRWLSEYFRGNVCTEIVHQLRVRAESPQLALMHLGFRGCLYALAADRQVPVMAYSPREVRRFLEAPEDADPAAILELARGFWPEVEQIAQAYAVATLHLHLEKRKSLSHA